MPGLQVADKGKRLIVHVIEERARHGYDRPFALIPKTKEPKDGFDELSYPQLAAAVDAACWWLDDNIGRANNFTPFAFLGPVTDPRYIVLVLAAMKTGHKAYLPSPRNSLVAHLDLLKQVGCDWLLHPSQNPPPVADSLLTGRSALRRVALPDLEYFVRKGAPHYPFDKTFDQAKLDPCVVLHTSGSTGIPKAVEIKHQYFTLSDAMHMAYDHYTGSNIFVPYPMFHCAGLINNLPVVVFNDCTAVLAPDAPITPDLCNEIHVHAKPNLSFLPAATIKDLVFTPKYNETLKSVDCIAWGGAPLATEVGVALAKVTYPMNTFGITEAGILPWELLEREDWQYLKFNPCLGAEYRHVSGDQYEMVMVRKKEHELAQGIFVTFPDLDEWPTKDLWSKHPTKPDLWMYRGRRDDIIVFSNGEKLNPLSIERSLNSHPAISSALVIGRDRFQAGMLVEPTEPVHTDRERAELLNTIWPSIEEINRETVHHGRVARDMILFISPEKPMLRAGKGSVQRQLTEQLYADEINQLFEDRATPKRSLANLDPKDPSSIRAFIHDFLGAQLTDSTIRDDGADFFSAGMDSLHVTNLIRSLNRALGMSSLTPSLVYKNPTVSKLSAAITDAQTSGQAPVLTREESMAALFAKYASDVPIIARPSLATPSQVGTTVLLTGSTGSIGSYLLHLLSRDDRIAKVICLNRSKDAASRQLASMKARGLNTELSQITFLTVDLSKPYFHLDKHNYRQLLEAVTHVVHNAWPVNFNLSLDSFEPHVRAVRRLVDFCASSAYNASMFFVSTMGTVREMPSTALRAGLIPEVLGSDWSTAQALGYSESKLVAENVLATAAQTSGFDVSICRVGQVAGPVKTDEGSWSAQEWLPSIIDSSKTLGVLPADLGSADDVDWVPVDDLSEVLVDLLFAEKQTQTNGDRTGDDQHSQAVFYHTVNPARARWSSLTATVAHHFEATDGKTLRTIPFADWLAALKQAQKNGGSDVDEELVSKLPALRVVPFLESLLEEPSPAPALDTTKTVAASPRLEAVGPVTEAWMSRWLQQWDRERAAKT